MPNYYNLSDKDFFCDSEVYWSILRTNLTQDVMKEILFNSELAYYYKLSGNVNVIISNAPDNKKIAPTKITLSFQSKDDERIIQFIDTLILNLQGFALIQKIDIKRGKGMFLTETSIDWYTAKKIRQDFLQKHKIIITPHSINSPIEEKYRISIWQGSIMP